VSKQKILVAVIGNGNFEKIGKCLLKSHPSAKMLDPHWLRIYEPLKPTEDNLHFSLTELYLTQVNITKISAFTFKKIKH
jgi:hypothetical protein